MAIIKKNVHEILNEVLEKSFVLSTIQTSDYTSFEHSLTSKQGKINRDFIRKGEIILLSQSSVRDEFLKESKFLRIDEEEKKKQNDGIISLEDDDEGEEIELPELSDPGYLFALIKAKDLKNVLFVVKDFEYHFKERKETTNLYHLLEEFYTELKSRKIKICLLTKQASNLESESNFKRFAFSNEEVIKECLDDAVKHKLLPKMNTQKVSANLKGFGLQEIENLIKSKPKDLEIEAVDLKRQRIKELNPEIEIIKPIENLTFKNVIGLERFKVYMKSITEKGMGKASLLLGLPGTGKSYCAKCLGSELGLDTIVLNFGTLLNKYVGK